MRNWFRRWQTRVSGSELVVEALPNVDFTVSFVERRDPETSSIERLIRTVGTALSKRRVNVRYDKLPYGNSTSGILANLFVARPKNADIYHITGHIHYYALLLPREKTVLTIHDLRILKMRSGFRRYLIKKLFFDLPARNVKYIVTGSEYAKRDLIRATNCPENRIHVIEHPLTIDVSEHKRKFDEERPRILQVGTASNKNLKGLISALRGIECTLVVIGRLDHLTLEALQENNIDFENRFDLTDTEIRSEYGNSDIVSFCSTSEGFGLPIIEAQAMMVPVVTSAISPMRDVAGTGALLVDPYDPFSIRSGIQQLTGDEKLRQFLVEKGLENVVRFSPDTIAGQYKELYQKILKR